MIAEALVEHPEWSVETLCSWFKVSKSGFYRWKAAELTSGEDEYELDLIQLIFEQKRQRSGARTIKMLLERHFYLTINLKKIRRLMKVLGLETRIRRKSKYNGRSKVGDQHATVPNFLERDFSPQEADSVYCTDVTYLDYGNGSRAYLSVIKDLATREIVHYRLSKTMFLDLVTEGLAELFTKVNSKTRTVLMVHSDQGSHYTSRQYRELLDSCNVMQSMSRRGNCIDNAPIESFFGHMKDEMDYKTCENYEDLGKTVERYMDYYNKERPQWTLNRKTPAECRGLSFRTLA